MKNLVKSLVIALTISSSAVAQNYICQSGETSFFSETPLENIEAFNKSVASVLNISTNDIAVKIVISEFRFQNRMMEEHFNENNMESSKYPNAIFKGKINETIDWTKNGTYDVTAKGILTIHGVAKERALVGKATIENQKITLVANFNVLLKDHNIGVPTLVIAKVAENISVKNKFVFVPLKN